MRKRKKQIVLPEWQNTTAGINPIPALKLFQEVELTKTLVNLASEPLSIFLFGEPDYTLFSIYIYMVITPTFLKRHNC